MSEAVRFSSRPEAPGYSASDSALEDVLFGPTLRDETPEGPTRTWVYQEGAAEEAGRFEPLPADPLRRRAPVIPLIKVETRAAAKRYWQRRSASSDGEQRPSGHF